MILNLLIILFILIEYKRLFLITDFMIIKNRNKLNANTIELFYQILYN